MALKITNREVDGVSVLVFDGHHIVFGEETHELSEKVNGLLAQGKKKLVLNMDHVRYIDSPGIGTLVNRFKSAKSQGASLRLCCLTPMCKVELGIFSGLIEMFDTEADAVRSFSNQPLQAH